jgi:alanine-glyoxylate transaminase/serine-glyoxylate transaminase/serine-pyruvate transaminase
VIRKACDMPRSTTVRRFARLFNPAIAGVKQVLETKAGEVIMFPVDRNRRLGSGDIEHAVAGRHGSGGAVRHVQPSLDRHVPAPRLNVQIIETPVGAGRADCPIEAALKRQTVTYDQGRSGDPQRNRNRASGSDIAAIRRALDKTGHPAC